MKKNEKVKLVEKLKIKAFHMNLAPGFQLNIKMSLIKDKLRLLY